jgi:hypothetical protein
MLEAEVYPLIEDVEGSVLGIAFHGLSNSA